MSQLYKKTEYVLAMPANRADGDTNEFAVQPCDQTGKPLSGHLHFLSKDTFDKEFTPVRRRPKPSKPTAARVRTRPSKPQTQEPLNSVNLKEV